MGNTILKLLVSLGLDSSGYTKGLQDAEGQADKSSKKIVEGLSSIGKGTLIAVGAAATAVVGFGTAAVLTAGRVDELQIVNEVLAKNAGISYDAMRAAADAIRDKGIEAAVAEAAVAKMIQAELDLAKASDIARIAQDSAVISNSNSSDAYDAIIHGITTLNPLVLRNQGLIVDSDIAYSEMADSLGKAVGELTGAEKQAAMMNAVIKSGANISGTYEAAMKNPIKQLGSMKRLFNDIAVAVGGPFLGAFSDVISKGSEFLKWIIASVSEGGTFRESINRMATSIAAFVQNVIEWIPQAIETFKKIVNWLNENEGVIVGILAAIGVAIAAFVYTTVIPAIVSMIVAMAPVLLVMAAVAAVAYLVYEAWTNNWGGIQEKTAIVVAWIKTTIATFLANIQAWWTEHGDKIKAIATALWDAIKSVFNFAVDIIKGIFSAFRSAFEGDWYAFGEKLREVWDKVWSAIKTAVETAWPLIKAAVKKIVDSVISFFKDTDWVSVGKNIIVGIADGIGAFAGILYDAVLKVAAAVLAAIKGFFGIKSPSKVFAGIGMNISAGLASGILSGKSMVDDAVSNVSVSGLLAAGGAGGGNQTNQYNVNVYSNSSPDEFSRSIDFAKGYALA